MTISDVSDYSLTIVDPEMVLYMMKIMDEANYDLLDSKYVEKFTKQNKIYVQRLNGEMQSEPGNHNSSIYELITDKFDHRTKAIKPASAAVIKALHNQGLQPRVESVGSSLGLIYEK